MRGISHLQVYCSSANHSILATVEPPNNGQDETYLSVYWVFFHQPSLLGLAGTSPDCVDKKIDIS